MRRIFRYLFTFILSTIILNSFGQTVITSPSDSIVQIRLQQYRQAFWDSLPEPHGWVNDFEALYSDEENRSLDSVISVFKARTNIEIAIVTVDTNFIEKEKFDDLALHIANTWKVGEKEKDNGIVITISRGYRRIRIQNGYGIEKLITDEETKAIIDNYFIPDFKAGNYYNGTLTGLTKLTELLDTKLK